MFCCLFFLFIDFVTGKTFLHHEHYDDSALQDIIDEIFGDELDMVPSTTSTTHDTHEDDKSSTEHPNNNMSETNRYIQLNSIPAEEDASNTDCMHSDNPKSLVFRETTV